MICTYVWLQHLPPCMLIIKYKKLFKGWYDVAGKWTIPQKDLNNISNFPFLNISHFRTTEPVKCQHRMAYEQHHGIVRETLNETRSEF